MRKKWVKRVMLRINPTHFLWLVYRRAINGEWHSCPKAWSCLSFSRASLFPHSLTDYLHAPRNEGNRLSSFLFARDTAYTPLLVSSSRFTAPSRLRSDVGRQRLHRFDCITISSRFLHCYYCGDRSCCRDTRHNCKRRPRKYTCRCRCRHSYGR